MSYLTNFLKSSFQFVCFRISNNFVSHSFNFCSFPCFKSLNAFQKRMLFGCHHGIKVIAIGQNSFHGNLLFGFLGEYCHLFAQCLNILASREPHFQLFRSDQFRKMLLSEIFGKTFFSKYSFQFGELEYTKSTYFFLGYQTSLVVNARKNVFII